MFNVFGLNETSDYNKIKNYIDNLNEQRRELRGTYDGGAIWTTTLYYQSDDGIKYSNKEIKYLKQLLKDNSYKIKSHRKNLKYLIFYSYI